jgi:hypothetical protein
MKEVEYDEVAGSTEWVDNWLVQKLVQLTSTERNKAIAYVTDVEY